MTEYKLEIPAENGRYRIDDYRGSYLVDVVDGVVMHVGRIQPKGTVEPEWKLEAYHANFTRVENRYVNENNQ